MTTAYESSYHKIARVEELAIGSPRVYRAAGATIVVRRSEEGVSAIDGSCLASDQKMSADLRVKKILECVASGIGSNSSEWHDLESRAGLPTRIENGEVWVCIESCIT